MKRETDPHTTSRAKAFDLWMQAPQPMVTLTTTLNVGRLRRLCQQRGLQFNALLMWCIGKAASTIDKFFLLPESGRLMRFDCLAVSMVVATASGKISTCDVPFCDDLQQFLLKYQQLTAHVVATDTPYDLSDSHMVIGTSALVECRIDCATGMYSGIYNNPFLFWGRYRRQLFSTTLPISFQFHHTQMDGLQAAHFLNTLQKIVAKSCQKTFTLQNIFPE